MKTKEAVKDTTPLQLNIGAHEILALVHPFLSKDTTREVLTKAAVLGKYLYATNGHSLIRILHKPLLLPGAKAPKEGAYDLLKANKEYILRPSAEDLTPPNFLAITEPSVSRPGEPFSFEWVNDSKTTHLANRSDLGFSLATWGICLDFEKIKELPLGFTYKVSSKQGSYGPVVFEMLKKGAYENQADIYCIIMPRRVPTLPHYTGPTKEEGLHADLINFVQNYRAAQFQNSDKAKLKALEPLDHLTKDLVRRIEGRA